MKSICISLILFAVLLSDVHAQPVKEADVAAFSNHGEVYFKIRADKALRYPGLPNWISTDGLTVDGWIKAYARQDKLESWLSGKGIQGVELLPHPGTLIVPVMKSTIDIKGVNNWDYYPTYDAYVDIMYQFQDEYPGLCQVETIGESVEGRKLLAAVISNSATGAGNKPQFLYTSSIHGDETAGYVLFLRLIDHLLSQYDADASIKALVDSVEIWINPLANPDGTYAGGNNSVYGATRFNANGVDLNRNYPDPEDGQHPDGNAWQTETQYFMAMAANNNFVMSANLHGGAEVFNYPWDTWAKLHADDQWWYFAGREWVDTVHVYSPTTYFSGFDNGVSNGYQWYSISGGRQDYMNFFHHCREFTLEISNTKLLPADQLPDFWEYNKRSFLNYLHRVRYGIRGRVVDAATGDPLKAAVYLENHDMDESWVSTNSQGWFFRPVIEGTHVLSFFSPAYEMKTMEVSVADNYSVTSINLNLEYTGSGMEEKRFADLFTLATDRGYSRHKLIYHGAEPVSLLLRVHDLGGRMISETSCFLSPDQAVYEIGLDGNEAAIYLVTVTSGKVSGSFKLINK